jgi:CelD/BcsL family acetyltransferase involved in cellulose biosynthesis
LNPIESNIYPPDCNLCNILIQIKKITVAEEFDSMENQWNSFIEDNFPGAYYLDHSFLQQWIGCYLTDQKIIVYLAYDNDSLLGIFPFYIDKYNFSGFPVSRLAFIGMGFGPEDFPVTGKHQEIYDSVLTKICCEAKWHIANFTRMQPDTAQYLIKAASKHKVRYEEFDTVNPIIRVHGTFNEYFESRSKNFRANFRKKVKRINEWGIISILHNDTSDLDELISKVETIGKESWQGEKGINLTASKQGRQFLNGMVKNFYDRKILDVSFIELDHTPIAYLLGACLDKTYYAIETAYLPQYFDASPGMLLHLYVIERLFEAGNINLIDFGFDASYKRKWTDDNRPEKQIILYNNTIYPRLIQLLRNSPFYDKLSKLKVRRSSSKMKTF